jgi:1-acyl-sn-glycerol-3-phosphate acyltransferase
MSKILGDNPFDDDEPAATAAEPADGDEPGAAEPTAAAEATPSRVRASRRTDLTHGGIAAEAGVDRFDTVEPGAEAEPADDDHDVYGDGDARGAWSAASVPDAVSWPDIGGVVDDDDVFLGEETVVPPGEYRRQRYHDSDVPDAELRELERRVDAQRTPAFPLDFRRRIGMGFLWKRWRQLAMLGRSDVVDDFGRDPRATARWEPVLDFLYSKWFRVETEGLDNIPADGAALLVANHAGTLPYDSAMVVHAVRRDHPERRDVRPLVEDAIFHLPWLGPLINRIGGVRACPENAERLLARGEIVAVFPEGVKGMGKLWRDRYRLQRFGRGGFVKLALRTGAPLIPVAVVGAEEAMPMGAKVTWFAKSVGIPWVPVTPTFPWLGPAGLLPLPSKWMIRIGEPVDISEYGPDDADDRLLVGRLAETVRGRIQDMVDDLRSRRRSPFG